MKRSGFLRRGTPLRRGKRLARVSKRHARIGTKDDPVYRVVDARTTYAPVGFCECGCGQRADSHHHTRKPRRAFHRPEYVVRLSQRCHAAAEEAYCRGRLLVTPDGHGAFTFQWVTARDKWEARSA